MSDRLDMHRFDEGALPGGGATFDVGLPFQWLGIAGLFVLATLGPLVAALVMADYGGVFVMMLVSPIGVFAAMVFIRSLRSPTKLSVEGDRLTFSSPFGAERTLRLSDLREVRFEEYAFLRQLTFEIGDFTSEVVKAGLRPSRVAAMVDYVSARPQMLFAGRKARTFKAHRELARGSMVQFKTYLEDDAPYRATSVEDIELWLAGCQYEFDRTDRWLRPSQFEPLRKGDCEDHALWAWNKMHRLGIDAEFCIGPRLDPGDQGRQKTNHAWLVFRQDGMAMNFETVDKTGTGIQPRSAVKDTFLTKYSVDMRNRTFRHRH